MVVQRLKPIGKVKKLEKWVPHELIENKKIVLLKYCLLLLYTTIANHFSIRLWLVTERDFMQPVVSSSVLGPRRSFKAIPKAKLAPQEGHGHCFMVCCRWDPLQLSESQQNHYIWEVCSENWWDAPKPAMPAAVIGQQKGPNSFPRQCCTAHRTTNTLKVEWIGLGSFASSGIFT